MSEKCHNRTLILLLLDHLVGASDQRGWNLDAKRLCNEVDEKFELGGLFDRQVSRLRALKYLIHVGNAAPVEVDNVRSIGHEPTELYKLFAHSHYRQPMLCREVDNALKLCQRVIRRPKAAPAGISSAVSRSRPASARQGVSKSADQPELKQTRRAG